MNSKYAEKAERVLDEASRATLTYRDTYAQIAKGYALLALAEQVGKIEQQLGRIALS